MFKTLTCSAVLAAVVSPVFAEPGEALRRSLGLEPGKYSLIELGVIDQTPAMDRAQRIKAIDRKKAAFQDMVRDEFQRLVREGAVVSTQQ